MMVLRWLRARLWRPRPSGGFIPPYELKADDVVFFISGSPVYRMQHDHATGASVQIKYEHTQLVPRGSDVDGDDG